MKMKHLFVSLAAALFLLAVPGAYAEPVNINTATVEQLQKIKGFGPKTAAAIVAYREEHGAFVSVDDLLQVNRIGEKTLERVKGELTVEE